MPDFKILDDAALSDAMAGLPDWRVEGNQIAAEFTFKNFKQAFAFITQVAIESEVMNHHPEWSNVYNRVSFAFSTHDAGDLITNLDTRMARIISDIAAQYQ